MTTILHHPNAETLLAHASGHLTLTESILIRLHAKACETCAHHLTELEQIGGRVLTHMSDTPVASNAFANLMEKLAQEDTPTQLSVTRQPTIETVLPVIEDIFLHGASSDTLNWQWRTKRFAEISLPVNDTHHEAKLIYIKKGMKIPRHTHTGDEYTLVLQGAFSDADGTYKRGDYIAKNAHDEHAPVALSDCICLALTTAPLKFTGTFGPVLNWMLNS